MSSAGPLSVDYLGEIHTVGEDERLSFGRRADLVVDENPYMHRVVGRFEARDDDCVSASAVCGVVDRVGSDGVVDPLRWTR